ncbi:MAG: hypothetical protein NTX57_04615 [Armatimonadetes bacterium]|nr:hypothetical protein [Armatimonadota bacterium]
MKEIIDRISPDYTLLKSANVLRELKVTEVQRKAIVDAWMKGEADHQAAIKREPRLAFVQLAHFDKVAMYTLPHLKRVPLNQEQLRSLKRLRLRQWDIYCLTFTDVQMALGLSGFGFYNAWDKIDQEHWQAWHRYLKGNHIPKGTGTASMDWDLRKKSPTEQAQAQRWRAQWGVARFRKKWEAVKQTLSPKQWRALVELLGYEPLGTPTPYSGS